MNYQEAKNKLEKPRNKNSKIVGNNTKLHTIEDGKIGLCLHNTDVIIFSRDYCKLYTGGWYTNTTKNRINEFAPTYITQSNSIWYMPDGSLFYEGIKVNYDGKVLEPKTNTQEVENKNKKIKAKIKRYSEGYIKALQAGKVDNPSSGDCWYCLMKTQDGKILGDAMENNTHLENHIEEKYYVPMLLVNAMLENGYRNEQIGLFIQMKIWDSIQKAIYKYMQNRLLVRL